MENVQLALTFDEVKEAELLAAFAEERIKEAEALFAQGEEDLANEILQQAIEQQELALEKYEQSQSSEEVESMTGENSEAVDGDSAQEQITVDPVRAAVEAKFAANLIALQTVLDKVENPKAKEALAKNVGKAQEKFEEKINKKMAKLQEKEQKADKKRVKLESKLASGEIEQEYNEELAEINDELGEEKAKVMEEISKEADAVVKNGFQKATDKGVPSGKCGYTTVSMAYLANAPLAQLKLLIFLVLTILLFPFLFTGFSSFQPLPQLYLFAKKLLLPITFQKLVFTKFIPNLTILLAQLTNHFSPMISPMVNSVC